MAGATVVWDLHYYLVETAKQEGTLRRHTRMPDGTCTAVMGPIKTETLPYTANWNLATATGTMSVMTDDGPVPLNFKADVSAPLPAHMRDTFALFGFDPDRFEEETP